MALIQRVDRCFFERNMIINKFMTMYLKISRKSCKGDRPSTTAAAAITENKNINQTF